MSHPKRKAPGAGPRSRRGHSAEPKSESPQQSRPQASADPTGSGEAAASRSRDSAAFLSTLAQITATLLAVFIAAVAAYYVFLQERQTSFEDLSAQDRVAISDTLRHVWDIWSPSRFDDPFPSVIATRYRDRVHKAGLPLVEQALTDLQLESSPLREVVEGINGKKADWRPAAFLWAFDSALQEITGEDKILKDWSPNAAGDPCDVRVDKNSCIGALSSLFPTSRNGIGFEQWRHTFESLYAKLRQLRGVDIHAGGRYYPSGIDNPRYADKNTTASVDGVFELLAQVNGKLDDIDKLDEAARRYAVPHRLHLLPRSAATLAAATFFGLLMPLVLLMSGRQPRPLQAFALLAATLGLCVVGFVTFGYDVVNSGRHSVEDYVGERWVVPMLAQLTDHTQQRDRAELVDVDRLLDARADADSLGVTAPTVAGLDRYIQAAKEYNATTRRLDATVINAVRGILGREGMVAKNASGSFSSMTPAMVLDDGTVDEYLQGFSRSKTGAFLSIESQQDGSVAVMITDANKKKLDVLRLAMRTAKAAVLRTGEASAFQQARTKADDASQYLLSALHVP